MNPTQKREKEAVLSDTVLIDCMAAAVGWHDSRALRIERTSIAHPGVPRTYEDAWRVSGCGLGGALNPDLRAALSDHFRSLVNLAAHDHWFDSYREALGPILAAESGRNDPSHMEAP